MVKTDFTYVLADPVKIQTEHVSELKSVVDDFPYFQAARALYLKALKTQDSFKYNNELKITAAHTTDRSILFDFITSKAFEVPITNIEEVQATSVVETPVEASEVSGTEEELTLGKPLSFTKSETHSFNEWLQLGVKKPIVRTPEPSKKSLKDSIIDTFIKNNPKIAPASKHTNVAIKVSKNEQESSLMTETLAKVYLEQKKYENAIQAYKILSLKYPEKSGFFADQIKRIQILQKK